MLNLRPKPCGQAWSKCIQQASQASKFECRHGARHIARAASNRADGGENASTPTVSDSRKFGLGSMHFKRGLRVTDMAHLMWAQIVKPGDTVVDATCGNGKDTATMSQLVGPAGTVHAFDIQERATVTAAAYVKTQLQDACPSMHIHCMCHSRMPEVLRPNSTTLMVFNLGYLPSSDHKTVTTAAVTLRAMEASVEIVKPGGLLSIMAYVGHEGGLQEYEAVRAFASELPRDQWTTSESRLLNRSLAPILICMWKHRE